MTPVGSLGCGSLDRRGTRGARRAHARDRPRPGDPRLRRGRAALRRAGALRATPCSPSDSSPHGSPTGRAHESPAARSRADRPRPGDHLDDLARGRHQLRQHGAHGHGARARRRRSLRRVAIRVRRPGHPLPVAHRQAAGPAPSGSTSSGSRSPRGSSCPSTSSRRASTRTGRPSPSPTRSRGCSSA